MAGASGGRRIREALALWAPVAAWMAMIFASSSRDLGVAGRVLPDWASHAATYGVLSILTCRALAGGAFLPLSFRDSVLAVAICAAYAASDELHQAFVPERRAEARDVGYDMAGAAGGAALFRARARPLRAATARPASEKE